ncbi:MAG: hypothetical protein ABIT01_01440, partial [Thermoanaerobaculia bacterium]
AAPAGLAELARRTAEWRRSTHGSDPATRALIDAGLARAAEALAIDPESAWAHATRGGLLVLRAGLSESGATEASNHEARVAFERALAIDPLLERELRSQMASLGPQSANRK